MTKNRVNFSNGKQWPLDEPSADEGISADDLENLLSQNKLRRVGRILTDVTRESHQKIMKTECLDFVCMRLADKETLNIDLNSVSSCREIPDKTFKSLNGRKYDLPTSFLSYGTFGKNAKNIVGMFSDWIAPDCDRGKLMEEVDEMCHSYDVDTNSFTQESRRRHAKISMQGLEEELQFMCESGIRTVLVSLRSRHVRNLVTVLGRVIRTYPDLMVWCKVAPKLVASDTVGSTLNETILGETSALSVEGAPKNTTNPSPTIVEYMDRWYAFRKEVMDHEYCNSSGNMLQKNFRLCLDFRQLLKSPEDFGTFVDLGGWAKIKYWMAEPIAAFVIGQSIFKCTDPSQDLYLIKHRDNIKNFLNLLLRGYDIPNTENGERRHFAIILDPVCNPESKPRTPKFNAVTPVVKTVEESVVFMDETELYPPPTDLKTPFAQSTPNFNKSFSPQKMQSKIDDMYQMIRRKTKNDYLYAMEEALEKQYQQKTAYLEKMVQTPEAVYSTPFFQPDHIRMRTEENNSMKLEKLSTAVSNALMDIKEQDSNGPVSPISFPKTVSQEAGTEPFIERQHILLIMFGAKSGVLIDRILNQVIDRIWKPPVEHPIRIIAVEPNNSFFSELRRKQKSDHKWKGKVWVYQEEFGKFLLPSFLNGRKADLLILDIISHFPELSIAAELFQHISGNFLADDMYMIPQKFSSFVCPVYAPKLSLLANGMNVDTESQMFVVSPGLAFLLGNPWNFSNFDADATPETDEESRIETVVSKTKCWHPQFNCHVTGLLGFYDVDVGDGLRYSNLPGTDDEDASSDLPVYLPFRFLVSPGQPIRVRCTKRSELEFAEKEPVRGWPDGEAELMTTDKTKCKAVCEWELTHPEPESGYSSLNSDKVFCDTVFLSQRLIKYDDVPDVSASWNPPEIRRQLNVG